MISLLIILSALNLSQILVSATIAIILVTYNGIVRPPNVARVVALVMYLEIVGLVNVKSVVDLVMYPKIVGPVSTWSRCTRSCNSSGRVRESLIL